MIVSVPFWFKGSVDGWTFGEVLLAKHLEGEPFFIVKLQNDGEVGYFAYSIGYPLG